MWDDLIWLIDVKLISSIKGISCCSSRISAIEDGSMSVHFHGCMLYCAQKCHLWTSPAAIQETCRSISQATSSFHRNWSSHLDLTPTATFFTPFHNWHRTIWCSKWLVFLDHRVKTHYIRKWANLLNHLKSLNSRIFRTFKIDFDVLILRPWYKILTSVLTFDLMFCLSFSLGLLDILKLLHFKKKLFVKRFFFKSYW